MEVYNLKPKYYFGYDAIEGLEIELQKRSYKKAYILYGKNSIKENGIYQEIVDILTKTLTPFIEFQGIEPNPKDTTLDKAIKYGIESNVDLIIAVGGGSVIDASKVIATLITNNRNYSNTWDYVINPKKLSHLPIPIISIVTLAGTASENNSGSVITNNVLGAKMFVHQEFATPFVAIMNPKYTFTVNKWQTASGIFDCFSHLLEQYFGKDTYEWTKQIIFANIRVLLKYSKKVIDEPNDYESRSNILWTTSMSLNGTTRFSSDADFNVHFLEHAFSGVWDITHGAGLALITPTYLKVRSKKENWFAEKILVLGKNVFNVDTVDKTIEMIEKFIEILNLPKKWNEFNEIKSFDDLDVHKLVEHTIKYGGNPELEQLYSDVINDIKNNI